MNKLELSIKTLILLIVEYKLNKRIESVNIANTIIQLLIKSSTVRVKTFNDEDDLLNKLLQLIESIISGSVIPDEDLTISIELMLNEKPTLINTINKFVNKDKLDKTIIYIKAELNKEIKKLQVKEILEQNLKRNLRKNVDIDLLIEYLMDDLGKIKEYQGFKDDALVDEIDFDNESSVNAIAERAKELISGGNAFATGWKCLNDMTQGGLRRGEFVTISALRHNYKSSLTKSLFIQMAMLNKPILINPDKKPMIILMSLEEEVDNIMFFFYSYLKYSKERIVIKDSDKHKLEPSEISSYIMKHFKESGYTIRVFRFIPELFTYSKLFSILDNFSKRGYEVQAVMLDYVKKMNREGCRKDGPQGTDLLDMFSRIRNYMSSNKILFVTPHQLNTQANQLIKTGLPPQEFVEHIADKNYYADSAQLGQEIDLELFAHKGKMQKEWHLFLSRGKHRIPTVIEDKYLTTALKFPKGAPIPEDNETESACVNLSEATDDFEF